MITPNKNSSYKHFGYFYRVYNIAMHLSLKFNINGVNGNAV